MKHRRRAIKTLGVVMAVSVGCLAPGGPADATLFGTQARLNSSIVISTGNLYTIDPSTGAGTLVADMGVGITGLAVQPGTGTFFGTTGFPTGSPAPPAIPVGSLVTINQSTGAPTPIGPLGLGTNTTLHDLAFDPAPGGALYGWAQAGLHVVNTLTGAASLVDEFGPDTAIGGYGLAFNAAGTLYLAAEGTKGALRTVDKTTGLTTPVVTLSNFVGCGCPEGEVIVALAFDGDTLHGETLYGVTGGTQRFIKIDVGTGVITDIGPAAGPRNPIEAIAFATTQVPAQVPEPAALLLTLSGIAALVARRGLARRRRAAP
jgi:hypothetical protein